MTVNPHHLPKFPLNLKHSQQIPAAVLREPWHEGLCVAIGELPHFREVPTGGDDKFEEGVVEEVEGADVLDGDLVLQAGVFGVEKV